MFDRFKRRCSKNRSWNLFRPDRGCFIGKMHAESLGLRIIQGGLLIGVSIIITLFGCSGDRHSVKAEFASFYAGLPANPDRRFSSFEAALRLTFFHKGQPRAWELRQVRQIPGHIRYEAGVRTRFVDSAIPESRLNVNEADVSIFGNTLYGATVKHAESGDLIERIGMMPDETTFAGYVNSDFNYFSQFGPLGPAYSDFAHGGQILIDSFEFVKISGEDCVKTRFTVPAITDSDAVFAIWMSIGDGLPIRIEMYENGNAVHCFKRWEFTYGQSDIGRVPLTMLELAPFDDSGILQKQMLMEYQEFHSKTGLTSKDCTLAAFGLEEPIQIEPVSRLPVVLGLAVTMVVVAGLWWQLGKKRR